LEASIPFNTLVKTNSNTFIMKKVFQSVMCLVLCATLLTSCFTSTHVVGAGGSGETVQTKQWFALWGLVPLNNANSQQLAGGKTDYTVTTTFSFVDMVIGAITGIVSVYPMTVKVKK
jgi:hypothetical protein